LALPMVGKVESLNAAVAGSVALYEALRQRSAGVQG
jgi:tRNA G18 (ribose-2'-O)-methylase SpoU